MTSYWRISDAFLTRNKSAVNKKGNAVLLSSLFLLSIAIYAVEFFHPFVPRHPLQKFLVVSDDNQLKFAFLASY